MSILQKKTAIILHSTSMLEDWENALRKCYGEDLSIGYYYGKKKKDGDVVIHIINSAVSNEFKIDKTTTLNPIQYWNQFGFVVFDECHLYANKFCGEIFKRAQTPYMLGLSATPDENINKFDKIVWWGIGPVLDAKKISGYQSTDAQFTGQVFRIMYYGEPKYTKLLKNEKTDMISIAETISMICDDDSRSRVVIKCIKECLDRGLFTYVFADRRNYLEKLQNMLIVECKEMKGATNIVANNTDFMRVVGGTKNEVLALAAKESKVIFTTYQYMGTGKSIIKMNALILATPRKSKMKQYIKRIFRLGSDTTIERHIYDIVDMKTVLKNQWYTRCTYYNSKQFNISEEKYK